LILVQFNPNVNRSYFLTSKVHFHQANTQATKIKPTMAKLDERVKVTAKLVVLGCRVVVVYWVVLLLGVAVDDFEGSKVLVFKVVAIVVVV